MFCICFAYHTTALSITKHKSWTFGRIGDHLDRAICLLLQVDNVKSVHGEIDSLLVCLH